jgi:hypothetical protein
MSDDAADEHGDPDKQPWQRVQVLVASTRRGGVPASRSRAGALYPGDVEQKNAERRIVGRDAMSAPTMATGARTSTPSDTKPSAAAHPRSAHTQNQRHPVI